MGKSFLCMLAAPLAIFIMELGWNFFQEAYFKAEAHRLWAFLSLLFSPTFIPSSFLLVSFKEKIKRTSVRTIAHHANCLSSACPSWLLLPQETLLDGVERESNASDTQSKCCVSLRVNKRRMRANAGTHPSADFVQTQRPCREHDSMILWTCKAYSEAGQRHHTAGLRQDEELLNRQEGTSGQRRKWAWSSEVRMIIPSTYVQSTVQILTN